MTDHPRPASAGSPDGEPGAELPTADTDGPLDPEELAARLTVDPARDDVKG